MRGFLDSGTPLIDMLPGSSQFLKVYFGVRVDPAYDQSFLARVGVLYGLCLHLKSTENPRGPLSTIEKQVHCTRSLAAADFQKNVHTNSLAHVFSHILWSLMILLTRIWFML